MASFSAVYDASVLDPVRLRGLLMQLLFPTSNVPVTGFGSQARGKPRIESEETMSQDDKDMLREEYDFPGGVRGEAP